MTIVPLMASCFRALKKLLKKLAQKEMLGCKIAKAENSQNQSMPFFMEMTKAYFNYGVDMAVEKAELPLLLTELQSLRKKEEGRWYWLTAEFIIDKILKRNDYILYFVRRKGMRKNQSVILQSNLAGMDFLKIRE